MEKMFTISLWWTKWGKFDKHFAACCNAPDYMLNKFFEGTILANAELYITETLVAYM